MHITIKQMLSGFNYLYPIWLQSKKKINFNILYYEIVTVYFYYTVLTLFYLWINLQVRSIIIPAIALYHYSFPFKGLCQQGQAVFSSIFYKVVSLLVYKRVLSWTSVSRIYFHMKQSSLSILSILNTNGEIVVLSVDLYPRYIFSLLLYSTLHKAENLSRKPGSNSNLFDEYNIQTWKELS